MIAAEAGKEGRRGSEQAGAVGAEGARNKGVGKENERTEKRETG